MVNYEYLREKTGIDLNDKDNFVLFTSVCIFGYLGYYKYYQNQGYHPNYNYNNYNNEHATNTTDLISYYENYKTNKKNKVVQNNNNFNDIRYNECEIDDSTDENYEFFELLNTVGIKRVELTKFIKIVHNVKRTNPNDVCKFCIRYISNVILENDCMDESIYFIDNTDCEIIKQFCEKLNLSINLQEITLITKRVREKLIFNKNKNNFLNVKSKHAN